MHESEHLQIVGMWSSGEYLYCVNKSEESLTLFRMSCSKQSSLLPSTSPESMTRKDIFTSTMLVNTTTTTTTATATSTTSTGTTTKSLSTTPTATKLPVSSPVTFLDTTVTSPTADTSKVSSATGATTSMRILHGITPSQITAAPTKSTSTGTDKPLPSATSNRGFSSSGSTSISPQSAEDGRTTNLKTNQAPWTELSQNSTIKNVTTVELLIADARKTHLNRTLESVATSEATEGPVNAASLVGLPRNKTETWILSISSSFSLLNTSREPTDSPTSESTEETSTKAIPSSTKELTIEPLSHWDSSREQSEGTTTEHKTKVPVNAQSTVKASIGNATQLPTPPVREVQQAVTPKTPEVTVYVGRTPVILQSKTEATGGSALSAAYFRVPLDLESNFTSVVNTKAGSMVVIPPSPDHSCYRSAFLTIGLAAVQTAAKTQFCNPAAANLSRLSIYESKVAAQFVSGNFFIASLYESTIEFVAVLKGQEALFDVHSNITDAQYSSVGVQICEGYPTVCVIVRTCPYGRECSAQVRCYRMARFMWSAILNMTVSPDALLHMATYSRSDRCVLIVETPIYRPWTAPISATLTIYRLKSSAKGAKLLVTSQERVGICIPPKQLRVVSVKRNIWLTTAIKDGTGTCIPGIYELLSDENGVNGEPLKLVRQFDGKDNGQVYAVMGKDVPACVPRGDVLLINTTGRAEAFLVDKAGQAGVSLRPMSHRNLPGNLQGQLKFVTIANHTFFMSVSGTQAITFNVICVN
ncbi:hypothetical protein RvY_08543 [Ramazzottius varieornatus]|uniref:Uncharacterized protein n=1 Tax=Ramazzottius varieornatus TaxID=947166 RepID=A0A1D1V6A8_RAMVA|nr:hypothetical protein RvY_08543 [Ramazzottius varieornatus]